MSERYILSNLSFRIKVVSDVLESLYFIQNSENFFFNDVSNPRENLFFTFNLRELFSLGSIHYGYCSKKLGTVVSFAYPFGYHLFNFALWNAFLTPINEFNSDRFSFGFRPYRLSYDSFLFINKSLYLNSHNFFSMKLKLNSIFNSVSINWLFKNCPITKNVLKSWFFRSDSSFLLLSNDISPVFCHTSLFFSLVNFIFNGLL